MILFINNLSSKNNILKELATVQAVAGFRKCPIASMINKYKQIYPV